MPRVPNSNYVASQGVPGSAPFEQATGVAFGQAGAEAAHRGAAGVEAAALLAQRHIQYIEAEEKRQRQANAVVTKLNGATEFFGNAEKQLQFGYKDESGQYVPPVGSVDYIPTLQKKFKDYQTNLLSTVQDDPGVKNALDIGLKRMYDARLINAQHFARTLHVQEQEAEDINNAAVSAKLAVESPTPEARDVVRDTFNAGLDVKYGNGRPKYVEALKQKFNDQVQANYMELLLNQDPIKFQIQRDAGAFKDVPVHTQVSILDRYNTKIRQKAIEDGKIHDAVIAEGRERTASLANYGLLSNEELESIKGGYHKFYKANEYEHIAAVNERAPDGTGTMQIRALRNEYLDNQGYMSVDKIQKYIAAATKMSSDLGRQHPELTRFKEELKADQRSITSMDNVQLNKNIKSLKDDLDQDKKVSPFGGIMTNIQKQKEDKLRAYGDVLIRGGMSPKEAAIEVRRRRQENEKASKETIQGIIDNIKVK